MTSTCRCFIAFEANKLSFCHRRACSASLVAQVQTLQTRQPQHISSLMRLFMSTHGCWTAAVCTVLWSPQLHAARVCIGMRDTVRPGAPMRVVSGYPDAKHLHVGCHVFNASGRREFGENKALHGDKFQRPRLSGGKYQHVVVEVALCLCGQLQDTWHALLAACITWVRFRARSAVHIANDRKSYIGYIEK